MFVKQSTQSSSVLAKCKDSKITHTLQANTEKSEDEVILQCQGIISGVYPSID